MSLCACAHPLFSLYVLCVWLLFGVNEKLLTQHISGPITKYRLLYVSNQGRAGARAWTRVRARAKG